MANIFSGSEIVEIGVQIEKNGRDFYNTLAGQSKNSKAKEIFKYLAGEEEKHIVTFQKLLEKVDRYEPPESYPGEYFAYMSALASEYVFTERDKGEEIARMVKDDKDDKDAIDKGIGFEKDSIIFYEGIKNVISKDNHRIIGELITQELNHLRQLIDLKNKLHY